MMLSALGGGGQAEVAARLAVDLVAVAPEEGGELSAGEVTGELQAGMTSSFTRWRRMSLGRSASSKWQRTASWTIALSSSRVSA